MTEEKSRCILSGKDGAVLEGFNVRTIIAALYRFYYASRYIFGAYDRRHGAAQWVTVILLVISKRSIELKKGGLYHICAASLVSAGSFWNGRSYIAGRGIYDLIWRQYLVQSPYAQSFKLHEHMPL